MAEYLIFTDDVDPITMPNILELDEDQFWKVFGKGRDCEMMNYDLIEGWLRDNGMTAQYGERYAPFPGSVTLRMPIGWNLAFDTPEQAFAFKMRWL